MTPTLVITGSTRGIGFGLADAFLRRGCAVTISGRTPEAIDQAVAALQSRYGADRLFGYPCDVTQYEQVEGLWTSAAAHFGSINIWINNAGIAHPMSKFWEHSPAQFEHVVGTNILGAMNGSKVALGGFMTQGHGALYNLEGLGADGRIVDGMGLYGSTKAAIHYLDRCLTRQTKGTPVIVGGVAPGMVITDMVTGQYSGRPEDMERAKKIFNIIAERVETVAPVLADKILSNHKNGVRIAFSSPAKLLLKFIIAPFKKRDIFNP